MLLMQGWEEPPLQVHVLRGAALPFCADNSAVPSAGTGEAQAEQGEDTVEAAKAAKEEYNRTLQEQEASLQQRHTDKMQVRPSADVHTKCCVLLRHAGSLHCSPASGPGRCTCAVPGVQTCARPGCCLALGAAQAGAQVSTALGFSLQGLRALQPRIQAWLGRMGGAAEVLASPSAVVQQAMAQGAPDIVARWDSEDKLGISVPFPGDQEATLWLDSMLPRVSTQSCLQSSRLLALEAQSGPASVLRELQPVP